MSAVYEYVGNLHMHTPYSDGEKWHKAIADAAIAAGLDFIVVTDHNIWVDGVEGYYENDQGRVLLLVGEEVHDTRRDPQCNHFLVYGAGEEMCRHSPDPQSLINATRALGACGFLAHPHERSLDLLREPELGWHNWEVDGFTGLEIWNYMSSFKSALARRHDRLSFKHPLIAKLSALRLVLRPEKYITGPEPETLAKWDELLAQGKRIAAVGNSDAHGTPMSLGPITREVFPYEFLFRAVNTHVLTRQPLNGDLAHDKALLLGAVGQGNSWVGYDMPASTKGFRFSGQGVNKGIMGDMITMDVGATLQALAPNRCQMRLIHRGEVVAETNDTTLTHIPVDEGAYRVEARVPYLGRERGWIFSNPIYLR
ncbi:MAG: CehA/McbA family metallohydrolase [Ardenticatenales bacterium]|nr:CehA/McbA family metallohydrolase [Ardenticatenales bacterium]